MSGDKIALSTRERQAQQKRKQILMKAMQKLTAVLIPTAVQQKEAWIYLRLHQKHYLPSYLLQPNPFRKYRVIMECTECTDMLLSSRNRK